jgi:hypothetical protein
MKRFLADFKLDPEKVPGVQLLLFGLFLGIAAQITLYLATSAAGDSPSYWDITKWLVNPGSNNSPLLGLLLYLLAGSLFIAGVYRIGGKQTNYPISHEAFPAPPPRFGFWLTSIGVSALTCIYAAQPTLANSNGYGLTALWILSILLFSITILLSSGWQIPGSRKIIDWLSANRSEIFVVSLILIGAFLLRFVDVELHPYSFINDEGEIGKVGQCILSGNCNNLFTISWASQPTLTFTPVALSIAIFGNTALAIRMVSILTGVLAVLFTYLFARETFGKKAAWVASILLASLPYHVHFSRIGVDNINDSLSSSVLLWLVFRATRKGTPGWYLAAGIAAGLCMYTYPGTRLSLLLAVGALGFIALRTPGFLHAQWKNLAVFALAAFITAAPINAVFYTLPDQFFARFNGEGILQNGALQAEVRDAGISAVTILTRQFLQSSLVFIATAAPSQFFNSPRAYYSIVGAIFLMFGLFITARRILDTRNMTIFVWFFAAIILGSTFTGGPPSSQRMLSSSPASAIIAAIGLVACIEALQLSSVFLRRTAPTLLLLALLINSSQDISYYFQDYRAGHYFEDPSNEITFESRAIVTPLGESGNFYLIGAPMTLTSFGNFSYFSPDVTKVDFNEITRENLAALPKDKDALFLAIPYRETDLLKIEEWLPGGQKISEQRRYQPDQPLFYAYKVTRAQLQAFQP